MSGLSFQSHRIDHKTSAVEHIAYLNRLLKNIPAEDRVKVKLHVSGNLHMPTGDGATPLLTVHVGIAWNEPPATDILTTPSAFAGGDL